MFVFVVQWAMVVIAEVIQLIFGIFPNNILPIPFYFPLCLALSILRLAPIARLLVNVYKRTHVSPSVAVLPSVRFSRSSAYFLTLVIASEVFFR